MMCRTAQGQPIPDQPLAYLPIAFAHRPRFSQRTSRLRPTFTRFPALFLVVAGVALSGCSVFSSLTFPPQTRGNKVDPELLAQLVPGTSTRSDATALIGSPTARATFDDNTWIYIGEVTKPVIAGTQSVENQEVVVLTFDQGGVLQNIERKNQNDAQNVTVVSRTTPSPGNNASIMQQLLGNVGRFNPASGLGGLGGSSSPLTGGTGGANQY
jgi:outer membrane protein assembly factor BamE (lipoprotein component of BamABCDE complex)